MKKRKILIMLIMVIIYIFLSKGISGSCNEANNAISQEDINKIQEAYDESEESLDKLYDYINEIKSNNEV